MAEYRFGFIGAGNMGGALLRAAAKSVPAAELIVADSDASRAQALAAELGCACGSNADIAAKAEYVFLGVKPQVMAGMLADIRPFLQARRNGVTLVTMAAGLSIARIGDMAGGNLPIIRIMPNTSAAVGEGMILYAAGEGVTPDRLQRFLDGMRGAGRFDALPEALIDAGCAVSGCGPAFVYLFIEALADGGVMAGLPRDKAQTLAAQTALGAARMVLETGKHPGQLKDDVCSPGGSTIAGVKALEDGGFRAACMSAVLEAHRRTVELGK